ncbi:HAMP domain-containing histidine kinase [Candidatus Woesebacteria bacterium]|nr:MAG: HAMP domain-containing histidine kinase [Candidatus Woesebacteria bacterium]
MRFNLGNMFQSARIKLTIWYVIFALVVSTIFSLIIYKEITVVLEKQFYLIEQQFKSGAYGFEVTPIPSPFFEKDLEKVNEKLIISLVYLNGFILLFATVAGSFLASKTLEPIESTLENQKRFVIDASHELKTPVTAIKTTIEVTLRNKKLKLVDARSVLLDCLEEADNLHKLITNLLNLARLHDKDTNLKVEKFETSKCITNVVSKFESVATLAEVDIHTHLIFGKIEAEKENFEKIITILLDNALKYTGKKGKIDITSKIKGKYFVLSLSDTGVGIPKKDIPHVFDRFYRVDRSRSKANIDGFGLGLSLAKNIVDNHNGKITVKSKIGKGTTFTTKLPVKQQRKF